MSTKIHAQDLQPYCRSAKLATTGEGDIGLHLLGGQNNQRPHWVPNDPEESLRFKSIRATPHPLTVPGNKATVYPNTVRQREHDQLPGKIPQYPEVK